MADDWITIQVKGIQADFPRSPLQMTFDVPIHDTSSQIDLYSVPLKTGTLVLSVFTSSIVDDHWLQKELFHNFFAKILVPHFFFNPAIFHQQQTFHYQLTNDKKIASFQFSYQDTDFGGTKRLEGQAIVNRHTLYTYFYLASENTFDPEILQRFILAVKSF